MDVFMSKPEGNIGNVTVDGNTFILEFVGNTAYDLAAFDSKNNAMKFYKKSGETYTEVTRA